MSNLLAAPFAAGPGLQDEWLEIYLKLKIAGQEYKVWGANVKNIELEMDVWGLHGHLDFWLTDDKAHGGEEEDKLKAAFIKPDLCEMELSIRPHRPDRDDPAVKTTPLVIKAIVSDKTIFEQGYWRTEKCEILSRRYSIRFHDVAQLFWGQHFPCALYTKKSMKDVIGTHTGSKIKFTYESQVVEEQKPLIFLGHDPDVVGQASFYDLLIWYVDTRNILLNYDYKQDSYLLADQKKPPTTAIPIICEDVAQMTTYFPEVPRIQARVHNSYTEGPRTQATSRPEAETPLFADRLLRTPIAAEFDARVTLETARLRNPEPALFIAYKRLPAQLFGPGEWLDFRTDQQWPMAGIAVPDTAKAEQQRVTTVHLTLRADDQGFEKRPGGPYGVYHGRLVMETESESSKRVRLPAYVTPTYPRFVEGKIVSAKGADNEETYDIDTDSQTSVDRYKVEIPLWENQVVFAPFNPNRMMGHFYFPAYKHERVVCAFDFEDVWISSFVDWKVQGRLPLETQGNHLLMGKTPENNTSMRHVYENEQPVFQLKRTNAKDNQTLLIKEGYLMILVKEDK